MFHAFMVVALVSGLGLASPTTGLNRVKSIVVMHVIGQHVGGEFIVRRP